MKRFLYLIFILMTVTLFTVPAFAAVPYNNYTYDFNGYPQLEPQAYLPSKVITGKSLNTTDLNSPMDVCTAKDGTVYIADSGNNRILVLDNQLNLKKTITGFENNGEPDTFNNPNGLFITSENELYIADTDNGRVLSFDKNSMLQNVFGKPKSNLITDDFDYAPVKVAVDSAHRVFVVSKGVNKGMFELDAQGDFVTYFGAIPVALNISNIIWKRFMNKSQRQKLDLNIPTEYSSVDIDSKGFVYGTVGTIDPRNFDAKIFIHRLNPSGADILKRNGSFPPMGDVYFSKDPQTGAYLASYLCDVAIRENGIYSVLDKRMGRIFTYDSDGNLMYIFGGVGRSFGQFAIPAALDTIDGDNYLVVDSEYNQLVLFSPTKYGRIISDAVNKYNNLDYEGSGMEWMKAIKYTAKSELAYDGLAKTYYQANDYKNAMKHFKLANDRRNYSDAYQFFRNELITAKFPIIMTGCIILFIALVVLKKVLRLKSKKGGYLSE